MKNNILNTVRNYKFAIATFTALSVAGGASDAKAATQYWNTSGTAGTWTSSLWGSSASGSFTGAWVPSSDVVFGGSTAATTTFASTTVGDITVNVNTTISPAGSLTAKTGGSTITVADGVTLSWASQAFASGTPALTKAGNGTWNMGANGTAFTSGFTLNAGTIIISGANSVGTGTFTINGGVVQSSGSTRTANIVLGGDFTNAGTGTDTWSGTVALGSGTRTINNTTTAGSRSYTGIISGAAGAGLTFSGSGTGKTFIGNTGNTFSGPIAITGGEVVFNNNGAFGTTTSITLDGGRLTIASDRNGTGIAGATISADKNIYLGSTSGTSISAGGSTGVITYNGVIADKTGSTGLMSKQDLGTLVLGGVSTYTGSTIIGSGTLKLDLGNDRLPTGTVVSLGSSGANLGTFDLNGRNQQIAGLVSKIGTIASGALKNTVTSTTAATLDINVANGQTSSYGAGTTQNSGVITGALALTKSGLGTQVLGDANTYTGGTTVNGGALVVNGSVGAVTVNTGGSLGGSGTVGAVTLNSGGLLKPGNSPGTLTASSASWAASSTYQWQIDNATGTAGTNWDVFSVTGALDMSALSSAAKMNLVLESLSLANYSASTSFSWVFAKAASFTGIANGDQDLTSYFAIDTAAFNGGLAANLPNGGFQVVTRTEGSLRTLNLMAVPEPSTGALLAFGLGGLVLTRLLRRKQS